MLKNAVVVEHDPIDFNLPVRAIHWTSDGARRVEGDVAVVALLSSLASRYEVELVFSGYEPNFGLIEAYNLLGGA